MDENVPLALNATNPLPYLSMAYAIGLLVLVSYMVFLLREQKRLRAMGESLLEEEKQPR